MDYSVLEKSKLFHGIPASELRAVLASSTHHIQCYEKGEIIFHLMDQASRIGIILEGRAISQKYPCDVVALEPVTVLMFQKEDLLSLMYKNIRILENFTTEIASATYMLQQRLELLSYSGIAQKAAFWLLTQMRQTGNNAIPIPESVSKWAMLMNVSRPSLHRELKRLEQQGIIAYSSTVITIHDEEALQEVLSQ